MMLRPDVLFLCTVLIRHNQVNLWIRDAALANIVQKSSFPNGHSQRPFEVKISGSVGISFAWDCAPTKTCSRCSLSTVRTLQSPPSDLALGLALQVSPSRSDPGFTLVCDQILASHLESPDVTQSWLHPWTPWGLSSDSRTLSWPHPCSCSRSSRSPT